jgi:hypothetical protein
MPTDEEFVRTAALLLACLRCPELEQSVTFQRFLALISMLHSRLEAGEDNTAEVAEMIALRPAIEAEMKAIFGQGTGAATQ